LRVPYCKGAAGKISERVRYEHDERDDESDIDDEGQIAAERGLPGELAEAGRIAEGFDGNGGAEGNGEGDAEESEERRGGERENMAQKNCGGRKASSTCGKNVVLVVSAEEQIANVTVEAGEDGDGDGTKNGRTQMNGEHSDYCRRQREQQTIEGSGRSFEEPAAKGKAQRGKECGGEPGHGQPSNDGVAGDRKSLAQQIKNRAFQRLGFAEIAVSKRRKIVEVVGRQALMQGLFLAKGFETVRAKAGIEFTFGDAVARGEAHKSGADECAAKCETNEKEQAAEPEAEQSCGFVVLAQFQSV